MSPHPQERLSAYLDGELSAPERATVEAHLAGCAECEEQLAALAAVDEAARQLDLQAPRDYFDTFSLRVRARLEAEAARSRTARLPVWAWAVAAALLLAVVTPLTLRERAGGDGAGRIAPVGGEPAPVAQAPAARLAPTGGAATREVTPAAPAPSRAAAPAGGVTASARRREVAQWSENLEGEAVPREAHDAATPVSAPPADAFQPQSAEERAAGEVAPARTAQEAAVGLDAAALKAEVPRAVGVARRGTLLKAPAAAGALGAGATAAPGGDPEAGFARLGTVRPGSAAAWRELRDAWSAFAAGDPAGPRADEARVRAVEAGREAWRASGSESDEAAFREAANEYLERPDAVQKARVRALLASEATRRRP